MCDTRRAEFQGRLALTVREGRYPEAVQLRECDEIGLEASRELATGELTANANGGHSDGRRRWTPSADPQFRLALVRRRTVAKNLGNVHRVEDGETRLPEEKLTPIGFAFRDP